MKITLGGVGQPGTSLDNKTGSWRVNLRPSFLHVTCTACTLCALSCPEGCIYGKGRNTYYPDYDYCKGCGNCANVCPVDDIEMVSEETALPVGSLVFDDDDEFRSMSTG